MKSWLDWIHCQSRTFLHKAAVPVVAMVAFCVVVLLLGSDTICVFKNMNGVPCPGCGMTRAWRAFSVLDMGRAFFYHPLFLLPPLLFAGWIGAWRGWLPDWRRSDRIWGVILVVFVGTWVIRMILLFPHTPPMDFKDNALFPWIYHKIRFWLST